MRSSAALAAAFVVANPAWGALQTVTLSVPGMTCSVCPITVERSLTKVPGVSKAKVSYEAKEAVVTFEDKTANVEALLKATKEAGYPSTVKE
jgi:mercuric ion binding protein